MRKKILVEECTHYWVVDQPNGPVSTGRCKLCGHKEEFRNSMPGSGWDRSGQAKKNTASESKS
ncbi:MAG TPA: hypothetical protein EYN38_06920 [Flavobacteriales bacterium]|nr:hypothetical protein [Dehalococcoidia bacterium]HIO72819.1 hypothetical protein [Flavobacteriales bacterium]